MKTSVWKRDRIHSERFVTEPAKSKSSLWEQHHSHFVHLRRKKKKKNVNIRFQYIQKKNV